MKKFTRDYRIPQIQGSSYDRCFGGMKPCIFDIETTGFSKISDKVILTAMLVPCENGVRVTQFLAENHYEENRVIEATLQYMKDEGVDYLVTFNGIRFDIPFFNARAKALHFEEGLKFYDFDLYSFLRKHSFLPSILEKMGQKSIEKYFGICNARRDTINGGESVRLYNEYALTGNTVNEKLILTHNREDVTQLQKLMLCAGADDWTGILKDKSFPQAIAEFGFPVRNSGSSITDFILRPKINARKTSLCINGDQLCSKLDIEFYSDEPDMVAFFSSKTGLLSIEVPLTTYADGFYLNIKALGLDSELREHDAYVNGFFILKSDGVEDWDAINALSATLVRSVYNSNK